MTLSFNTSDGDAYDGSKNVYLKNDVAKKNMSLFFVKNLLLPLLMESPQSALTYSESSDEPLEIIVTKEKRKRRKPQALRKAVLIGVPLETFSYKACIEDELSTGMIKAVVDRKKHKKAKIRKAVFIEEQVQINMQCNESCILCPTGISPKDPILEFIRNHVPSSFDIIKRGSLPGISISPLL